MFFGPNRKLTLTRAAMAFVLCLSLLLPCFATLTLDPTFGVGGKATVSFPDTSTSYFSGALRVFVQPTGRIVVGGYYSNAQRVGAALVGLGPNGLVDTSFGAGGTVFDWRSDANTSFTDALMYADGTILRGSQVTSIPIGARSVRAVRLNPNGVVDDAFGSNVSVGSNTGFTTARPLQVSVRSDGKVLVLITDGEERQYFLYRLNPDGTRDSTYGANGVNGITFNKVDFPFQAEIVQMLALNDGKVLIVGNEAPVTSNGSSHFFVSRMTESGGRDKTFGHAGFLRVPLGPGLVGGLRSAILQPDGKLLVSGYVWDSDVDAWMMRFTANGRPDPTFGNGGVVRTDFAPGGTDLAASVALSPDGKIRIAGSISAPSNFLIARYSANGTLEENTSVAFAAGQFASANDIAIQPDGKLVVVGETKNPNSTGNMFAIARLTE